MDWMLSTGGAPSMVLIPLGVNYNNKYYTNDQCSTYLEVLITQLKFDDKKTHWRRRGLAFVDIINTDLKPILIHCNDQPEIFRSTIKLLAGVTMPIECLVFEEISDKKIHFSFIKNELTIHLYKAKEAFLDSTVTQVLIEYMKLDVKNHKSASFEESECGNFCFLLLRNILNVKERPSVYNPQKPSSFSSCNSQQNQLVCNLFSQGFDQLLLSMLVCYPQKDERMVMIAHVTATLFRNQPMENIQKRLRTLMASFTSKSYEDDDESTVSSDIIGSCESGDMTSSLSSLASYSSNKRGVKCKNFLSRKMKRQREARYLPTDGNVSELLEEFIVDFMVQNGFNTLVGNLYQQLLRHEVHLDRAHLFWFIAYFVGFVSILELDVEHIKDVLNVDILSFLTSEAVRETEKWEEGMRRSLDFKPRRLHWCVMAIREFLRVLETHSSVINDPVDESEESQDLEEWSKQLCVHLSAMRDLHKLFLLLLRQFSNPKIQDRSFLCNIIIANHLLLLILKRAAEFQSSGGSFDFYQHLTQLCSKTYLIQYGTALEDFRTNDTLVNDSILTFFGYLHYELGRTDLLCETVIIRPFSKIWEEKSKKILNNWNDLIECAIHNFTSNYHWSGFDDLRSHFRNLDHENISQAMQFMSIYQFDVHPDQGAEYVPKKKDIHSVINQLKNSGFLKQLNWIQSSLLTTCSAKLGIYDGKEFRFPLACLSVRQNIPCPIVPWTEEEVYALRSERFFSLLHGLGLLASTPQAGFYPCIPGEWSAYILYNIALIFGPIDVLKLDFDLSLLTKPEQSNPAGSLPHVWETNVETQSSGSESPTFRSDVSSRLLQWVEQSRIEVTSPERGDAEIGSFGYRLIDVDEQFFESVLTEEMSLDEEMTCITENRK